MAEFYSISLVQLIIGVVSFVISIIFIIVLVFFGKLLKHQTKIWALAKKGYVQIRHIREDMNEDKYFIRIKDDHYKFNDGIYMEQKDVKTNAHTILPVFDYELLSKKKESELNALELQLKNFFEGINKSKIMDIKSLEWGIPTLTYFGNNPNPINFRDIKKVYDAKNIASMMKRIIMTKEWKLVRMVLYIATASILLSLILGYLNYHVMNLNSQSLSECLYMLNTSNTQYTNLVNNTMLSTKLI